ncbi:MAG TPA: TolC family protein [Terriglobales bacterium]|nr:TolC family protein [Terriglobales bacterium]
MTEFLKLVVATILAMLLMAGCATRHYQAAPISPAETAANFQLRTLQNSGLKEYLEKNLGKEKGTWPPNAWDLKMLTLAAFYFNSTLEAERARLEAAQAAVTTAGARPNPTVGITPGIPSPYLFGLNLLFPIQTAGKRRYQAERAKNLGEAARFALADTAWKIRNQVRAALLDLLLASHQLDLLRSEEQIRSIQVDLLEQRLVVGEISRPEVDRARIELSNIRLAVRNAEGGAARAKATLAGTIGIPVSGLSGAEFFWPRFEHPPAAESLSPMQIQKEAVLNRLDVRSALADYAATQSALQLEIARQYPDVEIGPGYQYEEKNSFFTVGLSTTLPIFNRNQGPIAEAEARRKESEAAFLATQAQVIAQSETALARYDAALKELAEADESLNKIQTVQEQMARRAVGIGESDRLELNGVLLQGSAAAKARLDALGRAQTALGELENAVQRPLAPGDLMPPIPDSSLLNRQKQGGKQ